MHHTVPPVTIASGLSPDEMNQPIAILADLCVDQKYETGTFTAGPVTSETKSDEIILTTSRRAWKYSALIPCQYKSAASKKSQRVNASCLADGMIELRRPTVLMARISQCTRDSWRSDAE